MIYFLFDARNLFQFIHCVSVNSVFVAGNKYWSGLLQDYYGPRAAIYFKYLLASMVKGESFPLEDWRREWISLTNKWQSSRKVFTVKASGDTLNISRWLYDKYLQNASSQSVYGLLGYDAVISASM